jgi:hypothetical protein
MSRITNDNPPKRGELLTSTDLNQVFTEVNDAFPMDGDNVRNEGIDMPIFSLDNNDGTSNIILIAAADDDDSASTTVQANSSTATPDAPTTVHEWTVLQTFDTDKIIRVYWQFETQITGSSTSPVQPTYNALGWAVWLEWKLSSGGPWESVPNQGEFDRVTIGEPTSQTYGCTIVNHVYVHEHSSSTQYEFPPERTGYGCWWYKADSDYIIYGLRLRCRGLIINAYDSTVENTWLLLGASSYPANHNIIIGASNIAYMVMEEK